MMREKHGFSLIELSMVLVIIALVIGAVLAAQTVIRAAHLQTMLGEYDSYVKDVKEFQDKFLALPGDMKGSPGNTPEDMWGTDPNGCPNGTPGTTTKQTATCNGYGYGTIGTSATDGTLSNSTEWFRAWQHLANAGFLTQNFTGTAGAGDAKESIPTVNVPGSAVPGGGWTLLYYTQTIDNPNLLWFDQYGHIMVFGGFMGKNITQAPLLTAAEALSVDQKIDDGKPGLGIVRAYRQAFQPNCTNDGAVPSQINQFYVPGGSSSPACSLIFLMRF